MKIGIDLRFIHKDSQYFIFILGLIEWLVTLNPDYYFYLFVTTPLDVSGERIFVNYKEGNFWFIDQFKFIRRLRDEKIDMMVFFSPRNAFFYQWSSLLILSTLKEVFYTTEKSPIRRNINLYFYKYALKKAKNIICFDTESSTELNARFDIKEELIHIVPPSFLIQKKGLDRPDLAKIAVNSRHALEWDFLIYDAGGGITRNVDRLIECIGDLNKKWHNISLLLVWQETAADLSLRQVVVTHNLQTKIVFLSELKQDEEAYYYTAALWVVNPSFYDPFPLHIQQALSYEKPMIMSELETLTSLFGKQVSYFNPLSKFDMLRELDSFLRFLPTPDYTQIIQKFTKSKTILAVNEVMKASC
jgi:glycosyltransferase involved in cell wall biosynthesis